MTEGGRWLGGVNVTLRDARGLGAAVGTLGSCSLRQVSPVVSGPLAGSRVY